ncbi:unnamed protein product, partial [Nesidiocoris tenuis]
MSSGFSLKRIGIPFLSHSYRSPPRPRCKVRCAPCFPILTLQRGQLISKQFRFDRPVLQKSHPVFVAS